MTKNIMSFVIGLIIIGTLILGIYTEFNTWLLLISELISLMFFIFVFALPVTFIFFGLALFLVISALIIIEFSAFDLLAGEVLGMTIAFILKIFWMDDITNGET